MVTNRIRNLLIGLGVLATVLLPWSIGSAAAASPAHPHIAIIVEENRNRNQVIGAADMPYFNGLANTYSNFAGWNGVAHPSEPNYIALISGSTHGVVDDAHYDFGSAANLGAQLTAAGVSWKAYMENLPSTGSLVDVSGLYARKHNPFANFNGNAANFVPATQFSQDVAAGTLPEFIFYVPNMQNDGHDAANPVVDASLRSLVEPLRTSAWYTQGAGSIIVTYDEDEGQGLIAHVVISEAARSHTSFNGDHYGTLRTIEESYGLPLLGAASSGTSFRSILGGTGAPPPPPPPPPTPGTLTVTAALSSTSVQQGGMMSGSVTVTSSVDTMLSRVALAARPPGGTVNGGPYLDIGSTGSVSLKAGVPTTISASRAATTSDPIGSWMAFGAAQKTDGSWQNGATVAFSVASAGSPPPPPPPPSGGAQVTIADVNGNNWWVQAHLTGADAALVTKVEAQIGSSAAWSNLPHQSWGDWAASYAVPAGTPLTLRATLSDGRVATSCTYSHPVGTCTSAIPPPPPPPPSGAFAAIFTNMRGNAWWIEANVAATGGTLTGVDASVNGGAWIPLASTSWGSYAKSVPAPAGSSVRFRADAADGSTATSAAKTW